MNIQALKELNVDRLLNLDDAVSLSADARALAGEYETLCIQTPEWLEKSTLTLRDEIDRRTRAADLKAMKDLETEIDSYATVTERKTRAQKHLAELKNKLGQSAARAGK